MKNRIPSATAHHVWIPKEIYGVTLDQLEKRLNFHFDRTDDENIEVYMPLGWCMAPDPGGGDWFYIFDDKDRKRALINKVSFDFQEQYTLYWLRRYGVQVIEQGPWEMPTQVKPTVIDSDSHTIWEGEWTKVKSADGLEEHLDAIDEGAAWLFENKPHWQDYFAYWDE